MTDAPNRPTHDPRQGQAQADSSHHDGPGDPHQAAPPPAPSLALGDRFVLLLRRPWSAMQEVVERPSVMVALGAIFLLMTLYTALNVHTLVPEQAEWQLEHATADRIEVLESQIELFLDPPAWLRAIAGLGSGFSIALFAVLLPGLLLHLFLRLSEGRGRLRQTLGVVSWAGLIPYGLRTLLSWVIVILTDSGRLAGLTLASLLPDPNPQSVAYVAASLYGDPFTYWMLWIIVLGVMQAHRLAFGRALVVTAATYVLVSAVPIGFTLLNQILTAR